MSIKQQVIPCDAGALDRFLNGSLSQNETARLTAHLDSCSNCCAALEARAAQPQYWSEAESLLRPSPFDVQQSPGQDDDDGTDFFTDRFGDSSDGAPRQPLHIQNVLSALHPTDDPAMLGRIGPYEVSGVIGSGGMGVVLKGVDRSLDRTVAIKVLAPHLASSGAARKRFSREAKAAAAVLHPNVIAIHSVANDLSLPYLVMPYVRGVS
ncbi:MAG: protein kinase, partial [Planctomycetota bacterium]|nr:protein kinase [Planctomycetota bacterium]